MSDRRDRKKRMMRASKVVRGNPFLDTRPLEADEIIPGTIPGVPSFEHGGALTSTGEHISEGQGLPNFFTTPTTGGFISPTSPIFQNVQTGGQPFLNAQLLAAGWVPLPGQPGWYLDPESGAKLNINDLGGAQPGGGGDPFAGQRLALDQEIQRGRLALDELNSEHARAIASGNLALARQIEARLAQAQQHQQRLEAQQLALSVANSQGQLGLGIGNLEARRSEFLSQLAANPRDFAQLNIALGGGQSFIKQLIGGQQVTGQSTQRIGDTPLLGTQFQELLRQVTARPEQKLLGQAAQGFQNVGLAKGGSLVTDEPIVGIGQITGLPRFTVGEGGKPEKLEVTPLQEGGTVKTRPPTGSTPLPPGASGGVIGPFQPPPALTLLEQIRLDNQLPRQNGQGFATPQAPAPAKQPVGFPDFFPGLQALIAQLFPESGIPEAQAQFGQGSTIGDIGRSVQEFGASLPRTQNEAIRRLSRFSPRQFHSLLPSQIESLASTVSALAMPPENFFQSILRSFPTGPNPASVLFGSNFANGGTILTRRVA